MKVQYSEVGRAERRRGLGSAVVVGLAGLAITVGVVRLLQVREQRILAAQFELQAQDIVLAIQREFDEGAVAVQSVASLFHASGKVERHEFRSFVIPLIDTIGSIAALGCNRIVPAADRDWFEASLRDAGFGDAGITERGDDTGELVSAPSRPEYAPVEMIEPLESNRKAVGYNIASEPTRRMAADRVRSTRAISATGPITLVQETGQQLGLLLLAPIFEGTGPESQITGFAGGVFRAGQLVEDALASIPSRGIDFELVDTSSGEKPTVVYCHQAGVSHPARLLPIDGATIEASYTMDIGGRTWTLRAQPTAAFLHRHQSYVPLTALVAGCLLSLLGVLYLLWLAHLHRRIAASEAGFQQIAENIREVFWIFDAKTLEPAYISPSFEEVYGRTRGSLSELPNGLLDCIHPEDLAHVEKASQRLLGGKPTQEEYRILREDRTVRWIRDQRFPVPGDRIVGVSADITLQKTAELERDRLQQKAIQTQKLESMGILAGGLAHQFNNLLTSIQGYAEMSLGDLPEGSPAHNDISLVLDSTEKATALVAQMLASAGKGDLVIEDIDLSRVVERMLPMFSAVVAAPEFRLTYDLTKDVPSLQGDPERIRQIVMNLVTNAIESLPSEGGSVAVRTDSIQADQEYLQATHLGEILVEGLFVYVEVEDTGTGMSPQTIQHVFDPFYTTKFTGRGLGMAAVLGIVRSQKGAIRIDSTPGVGTKVRVLFPATG